MSFMFHAEDFDFRPMTKSGMREQAANQANALLEEHLKTLKRIEKAAANTNFIGQQETNWNEWDMHKMGMKPSHTALLFDVKEIQK